MWDWIYELQENKLHEFNPPTPCFNFGGINQERQKFFKQKLSYIGRGKKVSKPCGVNKWSLFCKLTGYGTDSS